MTSLIQSYTATYNQPNEDFSYSMNLIRELALPEDVRGSNSISTSSQCSRAIAISNSVYGITPSKAGSTNDVESISWFQWRTELESNITSIKSTEDGSIVAASTTNGSVSLVRGSDGGILLNKSISSPGNSDDSDDDNAMFSHSIDFVQNTLQHDSNEMLMIYNLQSENIENSNRNMDMILVSNIDGKGLNSSDPAIVKASSKFAIDGITFSQGVSSLNAVVVRACLMREHILRFVIGHDNGSVSVHDYNTFEKKMVLVNKCIVEGIVDVEKGLHIDGNNPDDPFILVSVRREAHEVLCWYDLLSLKCVREYRIPRGGSVTALCPLKSCFENTVAAAIGMKLSSDSIGKVVILQGVLNQAHGESSMDTGGASQAKSIVTNIHQVYSIDLKIGLKISSLVDGSISDIDEYRVRYCVHSSASSVSFKEFCSGQDCVVAKVRLLLAQNHVEGAEEVMAAASKESISTPYGSIHSSEVVLARFLELMRNPNMLSGESKDQVKECLRKLSFGAVSGGSCGVQSLVLASKALYGWDTSSDVSEPYIRDYRLALSVMAMSIANAVKGVSYKYVDTLKEEINTLETKVSVLKTIETILGGPSGKPKVQLHPPLLNVKNHDELYQLLIERGAFRVAEIIRKSETGMKMITPKVLVDSLQRISVDIDPKRYCAWLKDTIFPSLTIRHYLLEPVLAWACKIADAFDENGSFGIDASILLLEVSFIFYQFVWCFLPPVKFTTIF